MTGNENANDDARSILVVDDDDALRERMVKAFAARGFDARGAANAQLALEQARADAPEMCVVDLRMPGPSGLELLKQLLELEPAMQVVMLTGYGSIATAIDAMRLGAVHYLAKPADVDEILAAFDKGAEGTASPTPPLEPPSLARAEWEHIQRVLQDVEGNVSEAARRLGIHRRSLQRKLQKRPPSK
jgi:two-component system response regulator RegA